MLLKLPLKDIHIAADRQRKEIEGEALGRLMDSIVEVGLRHPLSVREPSSEEERALGGYWLVNGERRLRAISNLAGLAQPYRFGGAEWPPDFAPAISDGELSSLEAESAEFAENEYRESLSWQERAAATARLASLRRRQAVASGQPQPTLHELASQVRGAAGARYSEDTRRELILADHLGDAEISKAKTLDDAWKAYLRAETQTRNVELARSVGLTFGAHSHTLLNCNCVEWLRTAAPSQFDVILTDPPYGIGADSFGDAGGRLVRQTHSYEDTPEAWEDLIGLLGAHWYRVAKEQAHLYVCCDIDGFGYAKKWLAQVGWRVHRTPLVNYKLDGNRAPWPEHGPQRKYELILYAIKGNKKVTRLYSDVIETRGDENLGHGAQKPVELFKNLLVRSVKPGDTVLDPFGGTGTTLLAAHEMQCKATVIEVDEASYGIALKRLKALT